MSDKPLTKEEALKAIEKEVRKYFACRCTRPDELCSYCAESQDLFNDGGVIAEIIDSMECNPSARELLEKVRESINVMGITVPKEICPGAPMSAWECGADATAQEALEILDDALAKLERHPIGG